jgi:hypothetical protein
MEGWLPGGGRARRMGNTSGSKGRSVEWRAVFHHPPHGLLDTRSRLSILMKSVFPSAPANLQVKNPHLRQTGYEPESKRSWTFIHLGMKVSHTVASFAHPRWEK